MATEIIATRIDVKEKKAFEKLANSLGLTAQDLIRVLVKKAMRDNGVALYVNKRQLVEAFESEQEATDFATKMSRRLLDETR